MAKRQYDYTNSLPTTRKFWIKQGIWSHRRVFTLVDLFGRKDSVKRAAQQIRSSEGYHTHIVRLASNQYALYKAKPRPEW